MERRNIFLMRTTGLMAALAVVFGVAMVVDPRVIEGAPAWLKPLKFAVSTAIYGATLIWILRYLPARPRLARVAATTTAVVFIIEVGLIALQVARGTTSHFNTSTLLDRAIFAVMGTAIGIQTLAAGAVAVALWRQTFADRALGWALRIGMTLAIAGASVGGLMTRPTGAQIAHAVATGEMPRAGAHTVGAPDGGPGLPGVGWSADHGDLRVPHFVGLHAMQVLPIVAILVARRRRQAARVRLVIGAGVSYAALFAILLAQALLGQSLAAPAGGIAIALAVWAAGSLAFAVVAIRAGRRVPLGSRRGGRLDRPAVPRPAGLA